MRSWCWSNSQKIYTKKGRKSNFAALFYAVLMKIAGDFSHFARISTRFRMIFGQFSALLRFFNIFKCPLFLPDETAENRNHRGFWPYEVVSP